MELRGGVFRGAVPGGRYHPDGYHQDQAAGVSHTYGIFFLRRVRFLMRQAGRMEVAEVAVQVGVLCAIFARDCRRQALRKVVVYLYVALEPRTTADGCQSVRWLIDSCVSKYRIYAKYILRKGAKQGDGGFRRFEWP